MPGRCVGRERELKRALDAFEQARSGTGTFIAVTGPSGIGKSTLVEELDRQLSDRSALVLATRCRPGLPSYHPLLDLLRTLLARLCETGAQHVLADRVEDLLRTVLGRTTARSDGDLMAGRIAFFDQVAQVVADASLMAPVVIALDDVHAADPGTRELIGYLGRLLTSAPELAPRHFHGVLLASAPTLEEIGSEPQWSDQLKLLHVELEGLSRDGVRALLASDSAIDRIIELTRGDPHLLSALLAGRFPAERPHALRDGLDAAELAVADLLAVCGRALDLESLCQLTGLERDPLGRAINALVERRLLEKVVVEGQLLVAFARAGDQQACYRAIPAASREQLHAAIGEYLAGRRADGEIEAAAEHLLRGRCGPAAVEAALAAGRRLESAFSFERAAQLYESALRQAPPRAVRRTLHDRLCAIYEATSRLDRALHFAERLRSDDEDDLEAALRVAHLHRLRGDYAPARAALQAIETRAEQLGAAPALLARVLAERAAAHHMGGDSAAALEAARRGLKLYEARAADGSTDDELDSRTWLQISNCMANVHLERGELERARELVGSNLARAQSLGLTGEEARAHIQLGSIAMRRGQYAAAQEHYGHARRLARSLGDHRFVGACLQHLGVLAERRRDYRLALEHYQDAVNTWKKVGHRSYLAWVGLDLGKLYLELGDAARASAMVELADRLADAEPPRATRINLELLRGRIAQHRGRYTEAAECFDRAIELAESAEQTERAARSRICAARLQLERGNLDSGLAQLDTVVLPPGSTVRLEALLLRAQLADRLDDKATAVRSATQALDLSEALEDPEVTWEAHFLLARLARSQGREADARRHLAVAAAIEREIRSGVPSDLRELMAEQPRRVALRLELEKHERAAASRGGLVSHPVDQQRSSASWAEIVGEHPQMQQVLAQVAKVARTDATVLIRGESGTGKELIADAIHEQSPRRARPLVKINCGALVESLLLSELFGHERGAFTGATQRKIGRFELAEGGTIFLDEIGDISPKTQVALLRVLQERTFERVGGAIPIHVDVRILFATNRDLEAMVKAGEFREDLYYRLRGVTLDLPPLRERVSDIPLLAAYLLERIGAERSGPRKRLSDDASALLCRHSWPGNVRELENVLRSVSLFSEREELQISDFADYPELARTSGDRGAARAPNGARRNPVDSAYGRLRAAGLSLRQLKKDVEADCIEQALGETDGNITRAAELLGMKRPRLSQLIKEHGIGVRESRRGGSRDSSRGDGKQKTGQRGR